MRIKDNSAKLNKAIKAKIRKLLEEAAALVERSAKEYCHRKTGDLARSITHEIDVEGKTARIGSNLEYAPMVELGTLPHEILPDTKEALYWEDAENPYARVQHPGAEEQPFLQPALDDNRDEIERLIGEQSDTGVHTEE